MNNKTTETITWPLTLSVSYSLDTDKRPVSKLQKAPYLADCNICVPSRLHKRKYVYMSSVSSFRF